MYCIARFSCEIILLLEKVSVVDFSGPIEVSFLIPGPIAKLLFVEHIVDFKYWRGSIASASNELS